MATQTSSAGKLAKLSARKQKYAELSKSLTVDLPDRQTNSEEKLPALSSERENLSTPQTNSFSGDSELQQEKRYWLSRVEEDQEQLKALLVDLTKMKERYLLAVESVEKEKDRLKALQLDAGMKAVDSYLLNECRPSLLGGTEDSTNQKVLSDERVSAAEKLMETLEDLNTKCKAKQAATTDYVSDLLKRITGAFCAEWDEYEQKLQENSATDPKSPANSLKNEPSIPGTEASSSVAAALSILRNFVLVESTIPMEVDPDLSPTTIVKPTKTKSLTGTTRNETRDEENHAAPDISSSDKSNYNLADIQTLLSENEQLKTSLAQFRKRTAQLRAQAAMNSQSKASGGQKPAANKQTNQQRGLPRTRSGSNWNGSGVNPGATRFYTSNSEDVFENDAIDHTNFNNSTDPTMSSMHGINVTQERRDEEEVINYFIKFEHATIYSKLQRKESGLAATVEEENPIKLLSQFLKLVLEQYVEGTLSAHPLSRAVPSHVLNQVADVLTAIESKDETGTEESKSGVAKDTVTILGLANSVFIALLRSNGIVYADMMDSLAGICDWEDDTAELLKSRMDTAVKSLIDFYDNNLDLREVSRAQYVVSTDQSDELSTSVKHAICSAARSCLRSSVLNEEIQSQATLYLSYIHSRNGYAVEEDEEIQGEKKDDTQEEQIETLSQDAGLDPWTTTNLEYPIPVENDCKDVFVDIRSESIRSDDIAAQVEAVNASTERELSLSEQDYIRDIDVNRRFQDMFQYEMAAPQDDNSGPYMIESFSCMNRNENSSNRVMARKASGISPNLPRYMQPKSKSHSSPRSGSEKR